MPTQRKQLGRGWSEAEAGAHLTADSRPGRWAWGCRMKCDLMSGDEVKAESGWTDTGVQTPGSTACAGVSASVAGSLRTTKFKCEHWFLPVDVSILNLQGPLQGKAVMMKNYMLAKSSVLLKLLSLLSTSGKSNNFYLNTTYNSMYYSIFPSFCQEWHAFSVDSAYF